MKKHHIVKRLLSFLLVLVIFAGVFYYAQLVLSYRYDCGENIIKRKQAMLALPQDSLDVVFIGSSGSFAGISPARLWESHQIASYNLSTSDQPYIVRYYNLKETVKHRKPKLLVMDITSVTSTANNPLDSTYEIYYRKGYNDIQDRQLKRQYRKELESEFEELDTFDYVFPFFKFHLTWDEIDEQNFAFRKTYNAYRMGGVLNPIIKPLEIQPDHMKEADVQPAPTNDYHLKYLAKCMQLCADEGIQVAFMITPRVNLTYDRYLVFKGLAEQYDVPLLNGADPSYMEAIGLDPAEDFYDNGHVNIWGNAIFTDAIGDFVLEQFPDLNLSHKEDVNDPKYAPWQEAVTGYRAYYDACTKKVQDDEKN